MDFARYVNELVTQAAAMRAAAVTAGPDAPVPTCPKWTVRDLVRHTARVHHWAARSVVAEPDGESPELQTHPEEWDELLPWWDEQTATLAERLQASGPDAPAWVFAQTVAPTAAFWARRQAHETAIHRLDAEHAAAGSASPDAVPTLVFEPDLAADGVDEALHVTTYRRALREGVTMRGTVLFHAADAGRAWLVHLRPGEPLEIGSATEQAMDADATVVGTADACYRAVWVRPSTAVMGGDHALIAALRAP